MLELKKKFLSMLEIKVLHKALNSLRNGNHLLLLYTHTEMCVHLSITKVFWPIKENSKIDQLHE